MRDRISIKIDKFFTTGREKAYGKGEILIRADEDPKGILYLKKGLVKMYVISRKGDELILNVFKEGSFFPMPYAINNTHNMYYFEAIDEVMVYIKSKDEALKLLEKESTITLDLLSRVYRGIDGLLLRMSYLMGGSAYMRLIIELIIEVKRLGKFRNNLWEVKITESDLASMTGLTRETISREIKILKSKNLLIFKSNKIYIKDISLLENELDGGV